MIFYYLILWMVGAGCTIAIEAVGYWDESLSEEAAKDSFTVCFFLWPLVMPLFSAWAVYRTHMRYKKQEEPNE